MAIQENGYLRGQIGNLINRKVGKQHIVQTKPSGNIRQTEWTKAAAEDFGRASKAGALLRRAFIPAHQHLHDGNMHNRLVRQMQRAIKGNVNQFVGEMTVNNGNIERLVNYQFNDKCHLQDYVCFDPDLSMDDQKKLTVSFPSFDPFTSLKIPVRCSHVVLKIDVAAFHFGDNTFKRVGEKEVEIKLYQSERNVAAQNLAFNCNVTKMETILVVFSVLYLYENGGRCYMQNNKDLHPVGIIGAFRP